MVPALFGNDITETSLVQTVGELGMKTLLVGFNGGDGPSNLKLAEYQQALENLRPVARMIVALAEKDLCEPIMVGPVHCHHRQLLPMGYKETDLDRWFDCLQKLAEEFGIKVAIEFLNEVEDKTEEPLGRIINAIREGRDRLQIHWDTGHAHMRGLKANHLQEFSNMIGFLEYANVGRWPLDVAQGIDFARYVKAMEFLPDNCVVGDEPFDQSVITAFDLEELCDTTVSGPEATRRNAIWYKGKDLMAA